MRGYRRQTTSGVLGPSHAWHAGRDTPCQLPLNHRFGAVLPPGTSHVVHVCLGGVPDVRGVLQLLHTTLCMPSLSHEWLSRTMFAVRSGGPCKQSTQEILDLVNACNAEMDRARPHAAVA